MNYNDAPIHPRLHFWFGPLTMMAFLVGMPEYGRNWNPGTSHEAHDWQLKAGIQSAIQDIQNNHPNDQASLIFFSTNSAYNTARVPMGQNYTYLTNALWYPYSLISPTDGSVSGTVRPYDTSFNDKAPGIIPTASGGTDSSAGLAVAYNQFSSNTSQGFTGRRGAVKMVLLETDGVTHDCVHLHDAEYSEPGTPIIRSAPAIMMKASTPIPTRRPNRRRTRWPNRFAPRRQPVRPATRRAGSRPAFTAWPSAS